MTGTGEHLVHALTRDAERTGQLGLVRARFVCSKQGATKVSPSLVEALKRVERLLVGAQDRLDFGVMCHASNISRKSYLHLLRKGYLHLRMIWVMFPGPVPRERLIPALDPSPKGRTDLKRTTLLALGTFIASLIFASMASATTGTWSQYPSVSTEYQAAVQQPINTANTSNWSSKSKGGIPVMFKLLSATGSAAFESIGSDTNTDNDYAFASFRPSEPVKLGDMTLKTDYNFTLGDCHGGSLRWSVRIDTNDNGRDANDPSMFIYYGDAPNFTDCTTSNQSGVNMVGLSGLRYDTSQLGGTFYDSYTTALALAGNHDVVGASLVLDSGWGGNQRANISNTTVNDSTYQFQTGGSGTFAPTCDLPDATIAVSKNDVVADGDINEEAVQNSLADSGNHFRVVDCKYQYILSVPSLKGSGTYEAQIKINDVRVPTPGSPNGHVKFDLK